MVLGLSRAALPPAPDLASALRVAKDALGHRPAVTVVHHRRDEQGYASLAQWAAKGAHLWEVDYDLGPGDWLGLAGPPGWLPAAVCLAAWWAGIGVTTEADVDVAVAHEAWSPPTGADVLWLGDAVDGAPTREVAGDVYATAVQAFPDQPPPARADGALPALRTADRTWTQAALLDEAARWGLDGPLGIDASAPPALWVPAVAVRPLRAGRPTVVLHGRRDAAAGEGVQRWVP